VTLWVVDGSNVMGAGADGWWNDPVAGAARTASAVAAWCQGHDDEVVLVFDGRPEPWVAEVAGGNLSVTFATRRGRDAADDRIVAIVGDRFAAEAELTVVTSDRGLVARLPPGVTTEGAGRFRTRLGLDGGRRHQRR
jgi:hypothetical protein